MPSSCICVSYDLIIWRGWTLLDIFHSLSDLGGYRDSAICVIKLIKSFNCRSLHVVYRYILLLFIQCELYCKNDRVMLDIPHE